MSDIQKKYNLFAENLKDFTYENDELIKILFINILINGSILIEDLPWVWKTTLSKALAKLIWYDFNRIQWTSDLIPQDIIWWEFYNFNTKEIEIRKWPIFSELLLIDEINRMNPKTQSAFLQAMEEKKVTIQTKQYTLDDKFFVIATQNPIEYSWTFPIPEAQKDRFTSRISLWMPSDELQINILMNNSSINISEKLEKLTPIITKTEIDEYFSEIKKVTISYDISKRLVEFFNEIKKSDKILYPLSQRWINIFSIWCKANAFLDGRDYVIPKDWEELIETFLVHRLDISEYQKDFLVDLYRYSFKNF